MSTTKPSGSAQIVTTGVWAGLTHAFGFTAADQSAVALKDLVNPSTSVSFSGITGVSSATDSFGGMYLAFDGQSTAQLSIAQSLVLGPNAMVALLVSHATGNPAKKIAGGITGGASGAQLGIEPNGAVNGRADGNLGSFDANQPVSGASFDDPRTTGSPVWVVFRRSDDGDTTCTVRIYVDGVEAYNEDGSAATTVDMASNADMTLANLWLGTFNAVNDHTSVRVYASLVWAATDPGATAVSELQSSPFGFMQPTQPRTIFADASATGNNDGTTAADAFTTAQAALDNAAAGVGDTVRLIGEHDAQIEMTSTDVTLDGGSPRAIITSWVPVTDDPRDWTEITGTTHPTYEINVDYDPRHVAHNPVRGKYTVEGVYTYVSDPADVGVGPERQTVWDDNGQLKLRVSVTSIINRNNLLMPADIDPLLQDGKGASLYVDASDTTVERINFDGPHNDVKLATGSTSKYTIDVLGTSKNVTIRNVDIWGGGWHAIGPHGGTDGNPTLGFLAERVNIHGACRIPASTSGGGQTGTSWVLNMTETTGVHDMDATVRDCVVYSCPPITTQGVIDPRFDTQNKRLNEGIIVHTSGTGPTAGVVYNVRLERFDVIDAIRLAVPGDTTPTNYVGLNLQDLRQRTGDARSLSSYALVADDCEFRCRTPVNEEYGSYALVRCVESVRGQPDDTYNGSLAYRAMRPGNGLTSGQDMQAMRRLCVVDIEMGPRSSGDPAGTVMYACTGEGATSEMRFEHTSVLCWDGQSTVNANRSRFIEVDDDNTVIVLIGCAIGGNAGQPLIRKTGGSLTAAEWAATNLTVTDCVFAGLGVGIQDQTGNSGGADVTPANMGGTGVVVLDTLDELGWLSPSTCDLRIGGGWLAENTRTDSAMSEETGIDGVPFAGRYGAYQGLSTSVRAYPINRSRVVGFSTRNRG